MQIHELDLYTGTPSASDYLAVDDGAETMKISAPDIACYLPLDTTAQSGDDYNLTQILTTIGWLNDVIV